MLFFLEKLKGDACELICFNLTVDLNAAFQLSSQSVPLLCVSYSDSR